MGRPAPADLLATAEEAARAAAELLLPRFGSERAIATKSSATDVVTEADLAAERAIRAVLARRRPDDGSWGRRAPATSRGPRGCAGSSTRSTGR